MNNKDIHVFVSLQVKKRKNISQDAFGSQLGRIHMQKQDLANLQTRKMKGLKRQSKDKSEDGTSPKKSKKAVEEIDT